MIFFHNYNFIQIHLLVSFKIEMKIKIIMTHSHQNVYKYMALHDFHSPSMKEERLRKKAKSYMLSDHPILSHSIKFILLDSLSCFFLIVFFFLIHYQQRSIRKTRDLFIIKQIYLHIIEFFLK